MDKQLEELRAFLIEMLNYEQDTHAKLFEEVSQRLGYSMHLPLKAELVLVHSTRVKLLEQILEKIKEL